MASVAQLDVRTADVPTITTARKDRERVMASVAPMSTRALRPATALAQSGDVDAGRRCRGVASDRSTTFARFSNVDAKSLGSQRVLATGIDRDGLTSRSTRRGTTVTPRAAARDSADDPSAAAPSHAPRASSPRELWELSGRSSAARSVGVGVGASPSPPPMTPTLAAGVALFGGVVFAAVSRRAASRREELELQRRFRGELIRRRLRTAVGRETGDWRGPTGPSGADRADEHDSYREVDYAGDRLMSARDVAFARARGLVRRDKTEDAAFLREADARNRRDAAAAAAISRGDFSGVARGDAPPRPPRPPRAAGNDRTGDADGFLSKPRGAAAMDVEPAAVRVTLGVTCAVAPGQTVWCTGGAPALGGWDMRASVPMDRVGADRWQCVLAVPFGPLEYRYVLATEMPETGGTRMESELGNARSRVVVSDNGPQLFVEETSPAFASAAPAGTPPRRAPSDAVARLARKHAVDADAVAEILDLTRGNEGAADKVLAAASRGLAAPAGGAAATALGDGARRRAFSSDVDVAERLRGPRGGQFAAAAAAMGAPLDGDDISEVAMNDDVTVVEDFTDVSDDELARLVADLRRELGDE